MATELDALMQEIRRGFDQQEAEIRRLRRKIEGDGGTNGLQSRVQALEIAQKRDDEDRRRRNRDWRDTLKSLWLLAAGGALGRAGEWLWGLLQTKG